MKKYFLVALWLALVSVSGVVSAAQKPLLMPGKAALYQRVLVIPGARMYAAPGKAEGVDVTPFSAFYVYQRKQSQGREWLQLGSDRHGHLSGWLAAQDSIPWNQGLTVVFPNPAGHDRVLLFRDKTALSKLVEQPDLSEYERLYQQAVAGSLPPDSPLVAIQPSNYIDIHKDFYLVPIVDYADTWLGSEQARMLKITSVPLAANKKPKTPPQPGSESKREYSAGLVFVIDATLSMDDYIERTREAVMKVYDQLGDAGQLGAVNFGLVAFRDNARAVPKLGYTAKTVVTLEQGRNPGVFLEKVAALKAAKVSSRDFREDAYAGIREAIDSMNWAQYDARYIVLITDAGAREGDDPLSTTGLSTSVLRQIAHDNGIALFVLHLLTDSTKADHAQARKQYMQLSDFPGIGSLYYGVPTGDVAEFGRVLDNLAQQISAQVAKGVELQTAEAVTPEEGQRIGELQEKVARLGYALRMQYLQPAQGAPPRIFNAWILDRDFQQPTRRAVDVRMLLTRDQLSDLHDVLKQVLQRAEDGLLSPKDFLDDLKSLAATVSRSPEQLGETTASTAGAGSSLVDMGLIGDYIEGLPYKGAVMNLSLEDWQTWPARQQIEFLRQLEEKIAYYRALHDNTDLWISLDGGEIDGDSVFPLSLEMLP